MHSLGQTVSGSDIEDMIKEADTNCNKTGLLTNLINTNI